VETQKATKKDIILMDGKTFRAMVIEENENNTFSQTILVKSLEDLAENEVLVKVLWSSLNYKDALSASGNRGVTKKYPHTPGIDAAGIIAESKSDAFRPGQEVVVTSYDLGMNIAGGFAEYIRVPAAWVVPMPAGLTPRESMILGTAGFTAGMSVAALLKNISPHDGDILVTGATGGVGSLAVAILARLGFSVVAVSGKPEAAEFLSRLGAARILSRVEACQGSSKPLLKGIWAGVIDTVGGEMLATAVKSTNIGGIVTCCGNVASPDLPLSIFPFILRGVSLVGIDSQNCPMRYRREIWHNLATTWKPLQLNDICREVGLSDVAEEIKLILRGGQKGRVLIRI
jgi:acrylyl-CoA reductase (NADPH)